MLRLEADRWKGTPHRMGGTDREGIDCSGFVMQVYKHLFNIHLPRMTNEQASLGRPIPRSRIHAGDLVFFLPPNKIRHVGIYLGDGDFVHASTSKGVIISNINDRYWQNAFWTARRIL
jgi:probable lipoprotein NlpC